MVTRVDKEKAYHSYITSYNSLAHYTWPWITHLTLQTIGWIESDLISAWVRLRSFRAAEAGKFLMMRDRELSHAESSEAMLSSIWAPVRNGQCSTSSLI